MKLARAALLPIWLAGIFSQQKSFVANPIIGHAGLNWCGLHVARAVLAHGMVAHGHGRTTKCAAAYNLRCD